MRELIYSMGVSLDGYIAGARDVVTAWSTTAVGVGGPSPSPSLC